MLPEGVIVSVPWSGAVLGVKVDAAALLKETTMPDSGLPKAAAVYQLSPDALERVKLPAGCPPAPATVSVCDWG